MSAAAESSLSALAAVAEDAPADRPANAKPLQLRLQPGPMLSGAASTASHAASKAPTPPASDDGPPKAPTPPLPGNPMPQPHHRLQRPPPRFHAAGTKGLPHPSNHQLNQLYPPQTLAQFFGSLPPQQHARAAAAAAAALHQQLAGRQAAASNGGGGQHAPHASDPSFPGHQAYLVHGNEPQQPPQPPPPPPQRLQPQQPQHFVNNPYLAAMERLGGIPGGPPQHHIRHPGYPGSSHAGYMHASAAAAAAAAVAQHHAAAAAAAVAAHSKAPAARRSGGKQTAKAAKTSRKRTRPPGYVHGNTKKDATGKQKVRLERNRDAAQAYRRRKKEQLITLQARIDELEAMNDALRVQMLETCGIALDREPSRVPHLLAHVVTNADSTNDTHEYAAHAANAVRTAVAKQLGSAKHKAAMAAMEAAVAAAGAASSSSPSSSSTPAVTPTPSAPHSDVATVASAVPGTNPDQTVFKGHTAQFALYFDTSLNIISAPGEYYQLFDEAPRSTGSNSSDPPALSITHGLSPEDTQKVVQTATMTQRMNSPNVATVMRTMKGGETANVQFTIYPPTAQSGGCFCATENVEGYVVIKRDALA